MRRTFNRLQLVCRRCALLLLTIPLLFACNKGANSNQVEARHLKAAQSYYQQGQYRPAVLEAQTALKANPQSLPGFLLLASIYNTIGAYPENSAFIEARLAGNPSLVAPLIESYFYRGKLVSIVRSVEALDEETLAHDDFITANKFIALAALQLDNTQVFEQARARLDLHSRDLDLQFIEAFAKTLDGDLDAAALVLDASLQKQLSFDAVKLRALLYLRTNKLVEAENLISSFLVTLPPSDVASATRMQLLQLMVDVLVGQGRTGEAMVYQRMLAKANPDGYFANQEIKRIQQQIDTGDIKGAIAQLNVLAEKLPSNRQIQEFKALLSFQLGNQNQVLEILAEGMDLESAPSALIQLGARAQINNQNVEAALELLTSAADLQPNNAAILASLALADLAQNPSSAIAFDRIQKSLALNPNQPQLYLAAAQYHKNKGDNPAFVKAVTQAYEIAPEQNVIALQYFQYLVSSGNNQLLGEILNRDLDKHRTSGDAGGVARVKFFKGWFALQQGQLADAQRDLTAAQGDHDLSIAAVFALADAYIKDQKFTAAIATLEQGLRDHPQSQWLFSQWYGLVNREITPAQAQTFLRSIVSQDNSSQYAEATQNWSATALLGELALNQNNIDEAIKQFEIAQKINPNANLVKLKLTSLYELLADLAAAKSQGAEAQAFYVKALGLAPNNMGLLIKLVNVQIAQGQFDQAAKVAEGYMQPDDRFVGHYLQAMIAFARGDATKGLKELRLSWSENATDLVGDAITLYFIDRNETALAEEFLAQWISLIPQSERAYLHAAQLASSNGNKQLSQTHYLKVLEINPQSRIALNNMALLIADENIPRAFEYSARALALGENSAEVLDTQGQLLMKAGKIDQAIEFFERALALAPQNSVITEHLSAAKLAANK